MRDNPVPAPPWTDSAITVAISLSQRALRRRSSRSSIADMDIDGHQSIVFVNRFFHPDHPATAQILSDLAFRLAEESIVSWS